jgi:hypothetical protein
VGGKSFKSGKKKKKTGWGARRENKVPKKKKLGEKKLIATQLK